jgi:hypothetical protein
MQKHPDSNREDIEHIKGKKHLPLKRDRAYRIQESNTNKI